MAQSTLTAYAQIKTRIHSGNKSKKTKKTIGQQQLSGGDQPDATSGDDEEEDGINEDVSDEFIVEDQVSDIDGWGEEAIFDIQTKKSYSPVNVFKPKIKKGWNINKYVGAFLDD